MHVLDHALHYLAATAGSRGGAINDYAAFGTMSGDAGKRRFLARAVEQIDRTRDRGHKNYASYAVPDTLARRVADVQHGLIHPMIYGWAPCPRCDR